MQLSKACSPRQAESAKGPRAYRCEKAYYCIRKALQDWPGQPRGAWPMRLKAFKPQHHPLDRLAPGPNENSRWWPSRRTDPISFAPPACSVRPCPRSRASQSACHRLDQRAASAAARPIGPIPARRFTARAFRPRPARCLRTRPHIRACPAGSCPRSRRAPFRTTCGAPRRKSSET